MTCKQTSKCVYILYRLAYRQVNSFEYSKKMIKYVLKKKYRKRLILFEYQYKYMFQYIILEVIIHRFDVVVKFECL